VKNDVIYNVNKNFKPVTHNTTHTTKQTGAGRSGLYALKQKKLSKEN